MDAGKRPNSRNPGPEILSLNEPLAQFQRLHALSFHLGLYNNPVLFKFSLDMSVFGSDGFPWKKRIRRK